MAEIHHFEYGFITPGIAFVLSAFGCVLGLLIVKKARRESGLHRARLLGYASVGFGAAGVWLPHVIGLLGVTMPGTVVRYDGLALGASLAVAVLGIGSGLFVANPGRRTWWRTTAGGAIIALGIAATELVAMSALRVNGTITMDQTTMAMKAALAVAVAAASLWCANRLNHLWASVVAGLALGAVLTALHYISEAGMMVEPPTAGAIMVEGLTPMMLLVPVILLGTVAIVMLAYFSIGNATLRDLHSIYLPEGEDLDPDLVREITSRIAEGVAVDPQRAAAGDAGPGSRSRRRLSAPRPIRPRPTPGTIPTWRSMPVWGTDEPETEAIPLPVTNARDLRRRHHPGVNVDGPADADPTTIRPPNATVPASVPATSPAALPATANMGPAMPTTAAPALTPERVSARAAVPSASSATPVAVLGGDLPRRFPPGYQRAIDPRPEGAAIDARPADRDAVPTDPSKAARLRNQRR